MGNGRDTRDTGTRRRKPTSIVIHRHPISGPYPNCGELLPDVDGAHISPVGEARSDMAEVLSAIGSAP
jgi:hypothetical protein